MSHQIPFMSVWFPKINSFPQWESGLKPHWQYASKSQYDYFQRIERLWLDIFKDVLCAFYEFFTRMEDEGVLDPSDEVHLYVLHYAFLPCLEYHCDKEQEAWNKHPLSTEHNKTPEMLYMEGIRMSMSLPFDRFPTILHRFLTCLRSGTGIFVFNNRHLQKSIKFTISMFRIFMWL